MLYKCANESCNTPFRRLREGKLFKVETEYFAGRGPSTLRKTIPTSGLNITGYATPVHLWSLNFRSRARCNHRAPAGRSRQEDVKMLSLDAAEMRQTKDSHQTLIEVMK
jgi:hypothetical protein